MLKSLEKVGVSELLGIFEWSKNLNILLKETEGDADEQEGKQGYLAARQCLRFHKTLLLIRAA